MNINYALGVASFYDNNKDGNISTGFFGKEVGFDKTAKKIQIQIWQYLKSVQDINWNKKYK